MKKTLKKAESSPLWLHPRGHWCKKHRGTFYYFGPDKEEVVLSIRGASKATPQTTLAGSDLVRVGTFLYHVDFLLANPEPQTVVDGEGIGTHCDLRFANQIRSVLILLDDGVQSQPSRLFSPPHAG